MIITDINLQHFRSYKNESFELSPNVNIIVGPNASGKTNLLEAILMISTGSSYRGKDQDVIQFDKSWARVKVHSKDFSRSISIEKTGDIKVSKTFDINTKKIKRLNIEQTIPIVLFEPNHLLMLSGSPELRRNYVDNILEQTVAGFKTLKLRYKRTLEQRNTLLKQTSDQTKLFIWNIRVSELGGQIYKERSKLIKVLQDSISSLYSSLSSQKNNISFVYTSECKQDNYETDLLKKLEQNVDLDIVKGFTSYGPHRDDLKILINDKLVSETVSRGEARTILLSLKVIEAQTIEHFRDQKPLLLFDDVFSELDGARRQALTKFLQPYQTFITTTDADVVVQHFTESSNIIPIQLTK